MALASLITTVTPEMLAEATSPEMGIDLGTFTQGWHDEWMWTPEYWKLQGLEPAVTSNTPNIAGIGNSAYNDFAHFWAHVQEIIGVIKTDSVNYPTDRENTEAFAFKLGDNLYILEVWEE